MTSIELGESTPDFELKTLEGKTFNLNNCLQENDTVLLVFLRHLG